MRKMMAVLSVLGLAVSASQASLLVNETFSHPNGDLVGNNPTPGPGGAWTAHSGAGSNPVQVVGGAVVLNQGSGSREDVNTDLGIVMGAGSAVYIGFDLINTGGSTEVYFAHLKNSATFFEARTFITGPIGGGDYRLGIGDSSTMESAWPTDLTFGESYHVVVSYDFDSQAAKLWVDPASEASPSITTSGAFSTAVVQFALRQAAGNSTQTIDNLLIGTTFADVPEPASIALLGLGAFALIRRR